MKFPGYLLQIAGLTMLLTGAWWILQGTGMIGDRADSYIAGEQIWAFVGVGVFVFGGVCLSFSRRFRK